VKQTILFFEFVPGINPQYKASSFSASREEALVQIERHLSELANGGTLDPSEVGRILGKARKGSYNFTVYAITSDGRILSWTWGRVAIASSERMLTHLKPHFSFDLHPHVGYSEE
jgi:hypothetical protein